MKTISRNTAADLLHRNTELELELVTGQPECCPPRHTHTHTHTHTHNPEHFKPSTFTPGEVCPTASLIKYLVNDCTSSPSSKGASSLDCCPSSTSSSTVKGSWGVLEHRHLLCF